MEPERRPVHAYIVDHHFFCMLRQHGIPFRQAFQDAEEGQETGLTSVNLLSACCMQARTESPGMPSVYCGRFSASIATALPGRLACRLVQHT
jgi:hypothetical protein